MKKIVCACSFLLLSLAACMAALILIRTDDTGFLYLPLFVLSGLFGFFACRTWKRSAEWAANLHDTWGIGIPVTAMFLFLPFSFQMQRWWIDGGGIIVYFGVFFALLILAGWLIGYLPAEIAARVSGESKRERIARRVRLTVLLAVVIVLLFGIFNLVFGNPVTAMIAGNDMRDWISDQADNGVVYEIRGRHLPRYDWYDTQYCFDLAGEGSRWVLHWNEGKIRIDKGYW